MKTYTSPDGYTVYRIESFKDFIDLPEEEIEGAIQSLELLIKWMRVTVAFAPPEDRDRIIAGFPDFIDWKADGECAVTMMGSDGRPMAKIRITQEGS